jgi:hypothetical protein
MVIPYWEYCGGNATTVASPHDFPKRRGLVQSVFRLPARIPNIHDGEAQVGTSGVIGRPLLGWMPGIKVWQLEPASERLA